MGCLGVVTLALFGLAVREVTSAKSDVPTSGCPLIKSCYGLTKQPLLIGSTRGRHPYVDGSETHQGLLVLLALNTVCPPDSGH